MLIKAYGQFWNPDIIQWGSRGPGNRGKLLGIVSDDGTNVEVDFWDAQGIYVLYTDFKPVYVGQVKSGVLGSRLRDHLTDRFAGRWDMFSWFIINSVNTGSKNVRAKPTTRPLTADIIIDTIEALSILVADPALNRKREAIDGALEAIQPKGVKPKAIRKYLEEILVRLPPKAKKEK